MENEQPSCLQQVVGEPLTEEQRAQVIGSLGYKQECNDAVGHDGMETPQKNPHEAGRFVSKKTTAAASSSSAPSTLVKRRVAKCSDEAAERATSPEKT